jgi:oxygen-independent coproporphyrinogen-3 oxidase
MRYDGESLTEVDHLNEYVMTSLRRVEGVDLRYVASRFGECEVERILASARGWIEAEMLCYDGHTLAIPTAKFMMSDAVIESIFA